MSVPLFAARPSTGSPATGSGGDLVSAILPANTPGKHHATGSRITEIADGLDRTLSSAIERIGSLNTETKFIAINAKMEAMRAGGNAGKAFGVVAQAVQKVSNQTSEVADRLVTETRDTVDELHEIQEILIRMRGERLADLAFTAIDLIDRNLYERTCDVRWWATDASVVDACASPTPAALAHATRRMGQILDAYTVYFDIVLADLHGRILANGRPSQFPSVGTHHANRRWFRAALACASGEEFGFRGVASSSLAGGQRSLVYSCGVRCDGQPRERVLGVLAVVFRWDALAQTIVERTARSTGGIEETDGGAGGRSGGATETRVLIVDQPGLILADTRRQFGQRCDLPKRGPLFASPRGHTIVETDGHRWLVGHATSPGFETYATGWHGLVLQRLD